MCVLACLLLANAAAEVGKTLAEVLASGKAVSVTPKPGGTVLTIRKWDPKSPPVRDIDPKVVLIGEVPRIRGGEEGWVDATRTALIADFLAYASAAKAGAMTPYLQLELARTKPSEVAMVTVLESAAEAGITDIWVTRELPSPPRKLPVNPAKPVAPRR